MTADFLLSQALEGFYIARAAEGYSPATLEQYRWALTMLLQYGDLPLQKIDTNHLRGFLAATQQKNNLSPTSLFHIWKAIRAFYKWAAAEGLAKRPDTLLSKPRYAHREIQPLSKDEFRALLKAAERTKESAGRRRFTMRRPTAERDVAILLLLLDTGIRASELCRLTVADVNLQSAEIFIRPHRSGIKSRSRVIPLGQAVQKALWRYVAKNAKNNPHSFFFGGMERNWLRQLLKRIGDRAGVSNVHPHRLRHTFAILFLRNGGDVFSLQRLLGHSSLEMTRHYVALAQSDLSVSHRRASPVDCWQT